MSAPRETATAPKGTLSRLRALLALLRPSKRPPARVPAPRLSFPAEGLDYSFSRPNVAAIAAAGYRFVGRYLGGAGKALDPAEVARLHHAGLHILLFWEGAGEAAKGGINQGRIDGEAAVSAAKRLGVPRGCVLHFCVDFEATSANREAIYNYLVAARAYVSHHGYTAGAYGGLLTMQIAAAAGVRQLVQTVAWSRGVWSRAAVRQISIDGSFAGAAVDTLHAFAPFGGWAPSP